jgi:hypothetical protein
MTCSDLPSIYIYLALDRRQPQAHLPVEYRLFQASQTKLPEQCALALNGPLGLESSH